jgi:hypothetical protein
MRIFLSVSLCLLMVWSCQTPQPVDSSPRLMTPKEVESHYVWLSTWDRVPPFDVYVTWKDFDPFNDHPRKAKYIYDGRAVGVGEAGFDAVLRLLRKGPRGLRVLMYPNYAYEHESPSGFPVPPPWYDYRKELDQIVAERDLLIIESPRGHRGNLVEY